MPTLVVHKSSEPPCTPPPAYRIGYSGSTTPTSLEAHVKSLPELWSSPTTRDTAHITLRSQSNLGKHGRDDNYEGHPTVDVEIASSRSSRGKLASVRADRKFQIRLAQASLTGVAQAAQSLNQLLEQRLERLEEQEATRLAAEAKRLATFQESEIIDLLARVSHDKIFQRLSKKQRKELRGFSLSWGPKLISVWHVREHIRTGGEDADEYMHRPDLFHRLSEKHYDALFSKAMSLTSASTLSAASAYYSLCSPAQQTFFVECYVQKQIVGSSGGPDAHPRLTFSAAQSALARLSFSPTSYQEASSLLQVGLYDAEGEALLAPNDSG